MKSKRKSDDRDAQVGAAIKAARERREMSQHDLGDALGVSDRMISAWELGQYRITLLSFLDVAKALKTPIGKLLADGKEK